MAIEEDANRVCLSTSETQCNRKRAWTWGFSKIANPAVNKKVWYQASGLVHFRNREPSSRWVFQFWGLVQASCTEDLVQDTLKKWTLHLTYHVLHGTSPFESFKVSGLTLWEVSGKYESAFYSNWW